MLAAAALGLSSCEYEFDNGSLTKETSIYIEGRPSSSDTNIIRIVKTLPYNVAENVEDSASLNVTKVSELELLKDGAEQKVYYAEEAVGSVPKGSYYTVGGYRPGEKLSLKVKMDGEKRASAETVIPQDVNWEYKITEVAPEDVEESENPFVVRPDTRLFHISFSFDNTPGQDDFYGINLEVTSEIVYYNEDGSVNTSYGTFYSYAANPPIENGDDIEDIMAGEGDSHVFEHDGIYLFDDSSLKEGRNTISYDQRIWSPYWGPYYYEKAKTKGDGDDDWTLPAKMHTVLKYKVTVYSLTRELFRYYASQYNARYNPLAELGLCPPSFAYSNIRNGIGCFAGIYGISSDWTIISDTWADFNSNLY